MILLNQPNPLSQLQTPLLPMILLNQQVLPSHDQQVMIR